MSMFRPGHPMESGCHQLRYLALKTFAKWRVEPAECDSVADGKKDGIGFERDSELRYSRTQD